VDRPDADEEYACQQNPPPRQGYIHVTAFEITDNPTSTKPPRRGRPPLPTAERRAHRIVIHLDDATAEHLTAVAGPDRQPGRAAYDILITALENT
jgi:hypothetical protein